jgi:cold shock CspA family protein
METTGTIKFFNEEKGFGFVRCEEYPFNEYFFHRFATNNIQFFEVGKMVKFKIDKNRDHPGKLVAKNLRYI